MPTGYVKKLAKRYGTSVKTAEGEWSSAKAAAGKTYGEENPAKWGTTTNIFKAKMKKHFGKRKKSKKNENILVSFVDFMNERMDNIDDIDMEELGNYVRGDESKM